jgi:hypothetical protein
MKMMAFGSSMRLSMALNVSLVVLDVILNEGSEIRTTCKAEGE